jgi:hypothetical protein
MSPSSNFNFFLSDLIVVDQDPMVSRTFWLSQARNNHSGSGFRVSHLDQRPDPTLLTLNILYSLGILK